MIDGGKGGGEGKVPLLESGGEATHWCPLGVVFGADLANKDTVLSASGWTVFAKPDTKTYEITFARTITELKIGEVPNSSYCPQNGLPAAGNIGFAIDSGQNTTYCDLPIEISNIRVVDRNAL